MTALNIDYTHTDQTPSFAEHGFEDLPNVDVTALDQSAAERSATDRSDLFHLARKIAYRGGNRRVSRQAVSIL